MCELFAVSSLQPVLINYSLNEFSQHGGLSHINKSGWGLSIQQNSDSLIIKEPKPAYNSPWIKFIQEHQSESTCFIAHVRRATQGEPLFENTHPFKREAYGRAHVFAHNGNITDHEKRLPLSSPRFLPLGSTDSEHVFCYLLGQLEPIWQYTVPTIEKRLEVIAYVAEEMRQHGASNFFYSDGEVLFAHADARRYDYDGILGPEESPALHWIKRQDFITRGMRLSSAPNADVPALLIASVPLSDDGWHGLPRGSVVAIKNGEIVEQITLPPLPEPVQT